MRESSKQIDSSLGDAHHSSSLSYRRFPLSSMLRVKLLPKHFNQVSSKFFRNFVVVVAGDALVFKHSWELVVRELFEHWFRTRGRDNGDAGGVLDSFLFLVNILLFLLVNLVFLVAIHCSCPSLELAVVLLLKPFFEALSHWGLVVQHFLHLPLVLQLFDLISLSLSKHRVEGESYFSISSQNRARVFRTCILLVS